MVGSVQVWRCCSSNRIWFFGIEYADISMLHIVPQTTVRDRLQAARAEADGDRIAEAMAEVAIAFRELVDSWERGERFSHASLKRVVRNSIADFVNPSYLILAPSAVHDHNNGA
jgi:hypothetical protein